MEDDDAQFLLDAPEYSEEEWQERPRCNWSYPPMRRPEYELPGFTCYDEPKWRFITTYSNASKTNTTYCHSHSLLFHEGVYRWAMIDHNTKASTIVIYLPTEQICPCSEGEECVGVIQDRAQRAVATRVERDANAPGHWNT